MSYTYETDTWHDLRAAAGLVALGAQLQAVQLVQLRFDRRGFALHPRLRNSEMRGPIPLSLIPTFRFPTWADPC